MSGLFVYDGSFQGLLTALQLLREKGEEPDDIKGAGYVLQESLLSETVRVATDEGRAERIAGDICERISTRVLRNVFRAFLSEMESCEYHIHRYLRLGWRLGPELDARLGDEDVHAVHGMSRATGREAHRMNGFLRFRRLEGGLYYAPMQPQCDVLCLVSGFFLRRMEDQDWMIHDEVREQAALYREGSLSFRSVPGFDARLAEEEGFYQHLWKGYYKTIAIGERRNPRVQKSCMPMKYWNMLVEQPGVSPPIDT